MADIHDMDEQIREQTMYNKINTGGKLSENINIYSFTKISRIISPICFYSKKLLISPVGAFIGLVLSTVFLHWTLINLYTYFCAPPTLYGLFQTMISLGSPMCYFTNVMQVELAKHYITIWGSAGVAMIAWLAAKFTIKNSGT